MAATPQTLATTSAFEVLGPVMVGPSSSHTAGALRCARVAASLLEGRVARVRFRLWNSFAHTYRGHGTDRALVAGVLGLDTDDERIRDAFDLAREAGLDFAFEEAGDDASVHPNTVDIDMTDESGARCQVRGESLGGGKMRISRIDGVGVDLTGAYTTLFVSHRDAPGILASLTHLLAMADVNIAFCRTYRTEQGGRAYSVFETDGAPDLSVLPMVRRLRDVDFATFISVPGSASATSPGVTAAELFDDGAQLLDACAEHGLSIGGVMELRERGLTGAERAEASMRRVIEVMREETSAPIAAPARSLGGFIGGEARLVATGAERWATSLMGTVQTDAVARAMAVLERSAAMGVIVAAPTAGSSGVVPGCVLAVADALGAGEKDVASALWCAAAVGLNIQTHACVAGAEGGCQAEVGSAAAMAAAALVELLGGTPEQALCASSLAIANLLGLVCDPVGGLVEVPCQARNAIGVAAAFSGAQLALSGVRSLVPFDEVVAAMAEVGHALPSRLRETARGGLAVTPTARAACAACGACGA
ncbi:L-serine ammonia-lyase, iron-sulfur-dependent, subunit alpha [Olsenella sp. An290]|uniref:L-serine ammonia-lyase, iron-sulfur-dependent, subunit alpha n=1 Tax=Olsenella sp. An290 TaxID=1965625 RepID=UPI000B3ACC15|nr:L-serine ammonia-lyase, iron-sulfur-dependent, subunit alpha [Olsenella sp. An290]OUO34569.1 serine dehydratase [Olsenella sp. An290]